MSKENFDDDKKPEEEPHRETSKKQLRFQIDENNSVESFISARSSSRKDEDIMLKPAESNISTFKSYVYHPLEKNNPLLPHSTPCFSKEQPETEREEEKESSHQLLEIAKQSPVPSNADLRLIKSIYFRRVEGIKEALRDGANVNSFRHRQTPLLIAAEIGDPRLVAYLLTVPGIDPDLSNMFGETALLVAVRNSAEKIVKLLLDNKADVNKGDYTGKNPLQVALFKRSLSLTKLLLSYGADCEIMDSFGEKPMFTPAVRRPHLESLLILLKMGAKPEYPNNSGISLLSRAILNCSSFRIIQTLVRFGASVNSQDKYSGKTPLHFAALVNYIEVAKYLLSHGADPNKTTVYNFTPFDEAVVHKNIEVAEILLNLTKKPKVKDFQALRLQIYGKNKNKEL